jgi:hypothetical protein
MKSLFSITVALIGVGIGGFFPSFAQLPPSSPVQEGETNAPAMAPAPKEAPTDHALGRQQRARPDAAVQFESETRRRTIPEQRRDESIRLHQNSLDRFENADSSGQLLLSFSGGGGVDLTLRNITGAEAPVTTLKPHEK